VHTLTIAPSMNPTNKIKIFVFFRMYLKLQQPVS
jgi:hypothetical protein